MVGNTLKSGEYVKSGDEFEFISLSGEVFSKSRSIAVLIDFKHRLVLAHGEPSVVKECWERLKKKCEVYRVADEFRKYMLVLEKADWEVSILNEIVKVKDSVPGVLLRRYSPKKAMKAIKRVPVKDMTDEVRRIMGLNM